LKKGPPGGSSKKRKGELSAKGKKKTETSRNLATQDLLQYKRERRLSLTGAEKLKEEVNLHLIGGGKKKVIEPVRAARVEGIAGRK